MEITNIQPGLATEPVEPQQATSKKRLLVPIIAATAVLVLAVAGILFWSNSQQKSYKTAAASYEKQVTNTFTAISGNPQNTQEFIDYLEKHETALAKTLADEPRQPKLATPKDAAARVSALTKATKDLKSAMQNYRLFLLYRDGVLEAVKNSRGTISTIDQLREKKTRLETAQKTIKDLKPPTGLEAHHKKQISMYDKPIQTMQTALTAYDKGDSEIFADKIALLAEEVKVISLPATIKELMDMHQYYDAITKAYDALEQLLK